MAYLIAVHALAAMVWVGGLFFLVGMLKPGLSTAPMGDRLSLFSSVIGRFFLWVWIAIIVLILTGYAMIVMLGGMAVVPIYVQIMQALAWVMILLFGHMFFAPWQRMRGALKAGALNDAARAVGQIRLIAGLSVVIGSVVIIVAAGGRFGLL